jgi:hypothetical protein
MNQFKVEEPKRKYDKTNQKEQKLKKTVKKIKANFGDVIKVLSQE